jgi:hypothetical protein
MFPVIQNVKHLTATINDSPLVIDQNLFKDFDYNIQQNMQENLQLD